MRECGILLPVSALPSKYGIGCFSHEAYEFIDQLKKAGQSCWQILPLGPTGYGDSPYQSFSSYAGNPYFIDLETLVQDGLITEKDCSLLDYGQAEDHINYGKLYTARAVILRKAFNNFKADAGYNAFISENASWLDDYCLYMAIKMENDGESWINWPLEYRNRDKETMEKARRELATEIEFYQFQQYQFYKQWNKLHKYATENNIKIIGDIPIYVALDSSDTWADPVLYQFGEDNLPTAVSGCPPDGFSKTGQLWGSPLYNWEYHKKTGYKWWTDRIAYCFKLYDTVRIDHFRGFDEYYSIPYGDKDAVNGTWMPGPGKELFETLEKKLGKLDIIAEDLGFVTDSVRELLDATGFPGMKVLQLAFDERESANYLPYTHTSNCVVYTGTHDNNTTRGWYNDIDEGCKMFIRDYINKPDIIEENISWNMASLAMSSVANLCIIPMQDYLNLGSSARINTPSVLGNNWEWRLTKNSIGDRILGRIRNLAVTYGRVNLK
ncbi:MAG: 4-alpha-glucanotransferase [Lachnospiraceae bacterium]|nr:4-alpha-glucanotransferase [Lachnospiraceae bacterium]MDE7052844.1 4-alpha-glucanotransferase [Lachnospiraceae bacterium]